MVHRRRLSILFAVLVMLTNLSAAPAQEEEARYFNQTGHWVRGEFLELYNSVDDPDRIFGSPITEALPDNLRKGIMIQYFSRVRMDLDPSLPKGQRVRLASLGLWMYDEAQRGLPVNLQENNAMCRVFANGKSVCFAFLQFYDRYNGSVLFGQPVSNVEYANDRLVQYFENVRMEWRHEMPVGQKVVITEIGRIDFDQRFGNPDLIDPNPFGITGFERNLKVKAFVARPLVTSGDLQTIYVITHDQLLDPWADVQVVITLKYPGAGSEPRRLVKLTGGDGFTSGQFTIPEIQPNQVIEVMVEASVANGPTSTTTTWFRSWW